ncbi:MAG: DUF971 domain-containing protein [Planctomycetaceae bacterium]
MPTSPPNPRSLQNDGRNLVIAWSDDVTHVLPWLVLRRLCPCASCRSRRERGEPLESIGDESVRPTAMRPLGNYAYQIDFNDGHNTGIYSLEFLRELGRQLAEQE